MSHLSFKIIIITRIKDQFLSIRRKKYNSLNEPNDENFPCGFPVKI